MLLSVLLRFFQETRADAAVAKLKAMINITATVVRGGQQREIPLDHLVPGDVVALAAGDMVPADVRVIAAKDLFISQASLTGESFPVEKFDAGRDPRRRGPAGTEQHLLHGHERRERLGDGGDRDDRAEHLFRRHGPQHRRPPASRAASTRACSDSPG